MKEKIFRFLGTGASMGVPVIGCPCKVCVSSQPKNIRTRTSALIQWQGKNFVIDVGPDFRMQAIREKIDTLDGVILTHTHSDHVAGMDDLRIFFLRSHREIPCLLSQDSMESIQKRYHYFFSPLDDVAVSIASQLNFQLLPGKQGQVSFQELPLQFFSYAQTKMEVTGYRLENLAYVTDIKDYSSSIFTYLEGIEILILGALCARHSHNHFSFDEAISFSQKVGAKRTYFTHLNHEVDSEEVTKKLPESFFLAYDGLSISFGIPKAE